METLAETSLEPRQRVALERFVAELRARLGDDLVAVWLYGSHARGQGAPSGPAASDVDVLVIARGLDSRDPLDEAAKVANDYVDSFTGISAQWLSPEHLAERRAIGAFYVKEIDRDKVVLYGDATGGVQEAPGLVPDWMERRTAEYLEMSRRRLDEASRILAMELDDQAVSVAYNSALNAARAALSEEDVFARTHRGTWDQVRVRYFRTGRIDEALGERAATLQRKREKVDYRGERMTRAQAEAAVRAARDFLAAVESVLAPPE